MPLGRRDVEVAVEGRWEAGREEGGLEGRGRKKEDYRGKRRKMEGRRKALEGRGRVIEGRRSTIEGRWGGWREGGRPWREEEGVWRREEGVVWFVGTWTYHHVARHRQKDRQTDTLWPQQMSSSQTLHYID